MGLFAEFLGALFRFALTGLGTWLVRNGVITADQSTRFTDGAVAGLVMLTVALGWSLWTKYRSRLKLLTAIADPSLKTEADVTNAVKSGLSASAFTGSTAVPVIGTGNGSVSPRNLPIVVLAVGLSATLLAGCGPKIAQLPAPTSIAAANQDATTLAATALGQLRAGAVVLNDISKIEETARPGIPAALDAQLRTEISKVAVAGKKAVADILAGVNSLDSVKAKISPFVDSINHLLDVIRSSQHPIKDKLQAVAEALLSIAIAAMVSAGGGGAFVG